MDDEAVWGGLASCLGAAALYCIGKSFGRDAEFLKSVPRVNKLKDLESKVLPSLVTVSGRAGSYTPIHCKHSGLKGVLVEQKEEYHYLKRNDEGLWDQSSTSPFSTYKEVPWYLDDGTSRVFITGAHGASDLVLTVGNKVFEESEGILHGKSDCFLGLKMLGVMRTEKVLATGTTLTVVGEAVALDGGGKILIRQPDGGPFYVSHKTIDQLIAYLVEDSRWYKYGSIGLAVLGVCILATHTFVYFRKRTKTVERPKRFHPPEADGKAQNESDITRNTE